jgi:serine/threonine protein kinase
VRLHSAFTCHHSCYLVMSCLSTDLRKMLRLKGSLPERSVVYVVACIGSALNHLHRHGIIHRDIKPENIGLDELGRPSLTDFGISLVSSPANPLPISCSSSGTLPYFPPEALAPGNCHSSQFDFWSLGVTAFELLFNRQPFHRMCSLDMVKFVANEYHWMWRELQQSGVSGSLLSPSLVDFEKIVNSEPLAALPFPEFEMSLNADGSRPAALLPPVAVAGEFSEASEECNNLLSGLMDVRLPLRLGSMTRFSEFSEHQCFLDHELFASHLALLPSPFMGTTSLSHLPSAVLSERPHLASCDLGHKGTHVVVLTPAVKELLSQIRYPSFSSSSITAGLKSLRTDISLSLRTKLTFRTSSLA